MDRGELESWLRRQLNLSPKVFASVWRYLEDKGYVGDVVSEGEPKEGLVREAEDHLARVRETYGLMKPQGRSERVRVEARLEGYEELRATLTQNFRKDQPERRPEVREFRDEILDGRILTVEQAHRVVSSQATATLSREVLRGHRVPIVGHTARFRSGDKQRIGNRILHRTGVDIVPPGVYIPTTLGYGVGSGPHTVLSRILEYLDEERGPMRVRIAPGSVLDRLRDASQRLSREVRWSEAQAARYILTGDAPEPDPEPNPVAAYVNRFNGTVTVEAQHWVSAKTVGRYYRRAQQEFLSGTDNRGVTAATLDVWRFVEGCRDDLGNLPTWEEMLAWWNRTHPDHHLGNRGALYKAYTRAVEAMKPPGVGLHTEEEAG